MPVPSEACLSLVRSASPFSQTIGRPPRLRSRNASGLGEVTDTVPAASSAVALAPAGTYRLIRVDEFLGSPTNEMFLATVAAVSGVPSAHVMPLRSVNVAVVLVDSHLSASPGSVLPSGAKPSRES